MNDSKHPLRSDARHGIVRPHRRDFLRLLATAASVPLLPSFAHGADAKPAGAAAAALGDKLPPFPRMARFPGKTELILLADRPPNLETPLRYFREDLTPNEAFYVRWHLAVIPTRVDVDEFRLSLDGHVNTPVQWSLDELKKNFESVSFVAVNQCSGNSRSKYEPRMPGVQWGNGAMGNARWKGVRLKDLLAKAGVKAGAVEVSFNGLDDAVLPTSPDFSGTPDFVKSLPFERANDGEVMVAYEMNGEPLPILNGFPLRLVVPGWYATYWVKALTEIRVLDKPLDNFWMGKAYRVPDTKDFQESPQALAKQTVPINRMTVRSLFVRPEPGEAVPAGQPCEVSGIALDGGSGIKRVEVSTDAGRTWADARLDADLGNYSWRRWRFAWTPQAGQYRLMVRATSNSGETQTGAQWNRSGYARNVIESLSVSVG